LGQLRDWVVAHGQKNASDSASSIQPLSDEILPVQPVIRDIWHDHLLFTEDKVTGIVDFGAMKLDSVAVDLSRLLGSLIGSDVIGWQKAIDHYGQHRPLSSTEIQFAFALNQSANLIGSLNWLKWILVERRQFESWDNVDRRIRELLAGLLKTNQGLHPNV
jgi:homoserine kinase type II